MTQRPDIVLEAETERAVASIGGDWGDFRVKRDIAISAALHLVLLALLLGLLPHWHDYAPPPQAVQLVIEERPIEPQPALQPEPPPPRPVIQTSEESVKGTTDRGGATPAAPAPHPGAGAKPTQAAPAAPGTTLPPAAPAKSAAQMSFGGVGTTSLEHSQYLAEVKHQILQFGYKLDERMARGRTGDVMVAVLVSNNGTLVSATIETSSGYRDIDRAATQMVELAAPFPPLPTPSPNGGVRLGFEVEFPVEVPLH
jgi:protein TonB